MGQITLSIKDDTLASLRKDYDAFVRVSLKLDPQFATPSFEDFLRAKLLDNMVPLTEHAVQRMLEGGQYAWAKRTLDKEFPDVVAILMRQAGEFGFGFASRSEWTPDELAKACRDWAKAIVAEAQSDASLVDPLAAQIKSAVHDIQTLEEMMQTPAWRLAESLRQRIYEAKLACEMSVGSAARDKLGELRGLLRLMNVALSQSEIAGLAAIGADVPVCFVGRPCVMEGIGEKLTLLEEQLPPALVLANPGVPCGTADVFRALALNPGDVRPRSPRAEWRNDMTAAAIRTQPVIGQVLGALAETRLQPVLMSGSGATCFGLARNYAEAEATAAKLQEAQPHWWVRPARLMQAPSALLP